MLPTSVLCIPLLQVAQSLSELFYWNVLVEREEMTLCSGSSVIDERVCIGGETSDTYDDVATQYLILIRHLCKIDHLLGEQVELLAAPSVPSLLGHAQIE
jgi:hypothetical protein